MIRDDSVSVWVVSGVEAGVYCRMGTRPRCDEGEQAI